MWGFRPGSSEKTLNRSRTSTRQRHQAALATFVLLLVVLAFARAPLISSTGIAIGGDAADYHTIASTMTLEGRAPFVYRPLIPLAVGFVFRDHLTMGFGIVSGLAMFSALLTAGTLARHATAGYVIATILFLNYQVLFSAAYPARLDITVLAVQLAFVWLALERKERLFFALLPLCAVLKESMLLGLVALALFALPRRRDVWAKLAASATGFVALHLVVRWLAQPSASMPPYTDGLPTASAMLAIALANLSASTALGFVVAWGGLCFVAFYLTLGGEGRRRPAVLAVMVLLLLFPVPLATDLHRAWFELFAPVVLFLILARTRMEGRPALTAPLSLALVASMIPYATRLVAVEHLYLLILHDRLSTTASVALAITLTTAAAALVYWIRATPKTEAT